MSKSNGNMALTRLEGKVASLTAQAFSLRNKLEAKEDGVIKNSLPIFTTAAFANTEMASIDSLAYNNAYAPLTLQYQTLMYTYKSQPIIQNVIDMPVQDALRGGLDFRSDELDKDDIRELEEYLSDINFYQNNKVLEEWARLFGGAAMLVNTDQDPIKPLSLKDIKADKLSFYPASRWELGGVKRYSETYTFYGERFDKSRVLTVAGKEAPFQIRWMLQDWGLSEVEKLLEPFNIYLRTQNGIYDLLKEAKVDIFQFDGFLSQLSSAKGTQLAVQRVQIMNQAKSSNNALIMDMKDKYEQKVMTFSGLAEMSVQNRIALASATRIPLNKLFGTGATGYSSGEDDIENYNALIESEVREHMRSALKEQIDIIQIALWGETFDLQWEYKPLRVMSTEAEEQVKTSKHNRYFQDMQAGMLTPKEYMDLQQKEKLIPIETEVAKGAEPEPLMMAADAEGEQQPDKKPKGGKDK